MSDISVVPVEEGVAKVTASFTNENGAPAEPTALTWTLIDVEGNVINARRAVTLTPATVVSWLIYGADLAVGASGTTRFLHVDAIYNSTLGTGLSLRTEIRFSIRDFIAVVGA